MMASVFFVLSPGLARLFGIVVFYRKFGSFRHPSFWLLMAAQLCALANRGPGAGQRNVSTTDRSISLVTSILDRRHYQYLRESALKLGINPA